MNLELPKLTFLIDCRTIAVLEQSAITWNHYKLSLTGKVAPAYYLFIYLVIKSIAISCQGGNFLSLKGKNLRTFHKPEEWPTNLAFFYLLQIAWTSGKKNLLGKFVLFSLLLI